MIDKIKRLLNQIYEICPDMIGEIDKVRKFIKEENGHLTEDSNQLLMDFSNHCIRRDSSIRMAALLEELDQFISTL